MHELYVVVARQLRAQRDSDAALKLWEKLWAAYEQNGASGIADFIEQILELPEEEEEEVS